MDREILEKMPNTCDRQSLQQVKASEGGHDYGGFMYNVWRLQVETKKHNQRESVKERESERERVCVCWGRESVFEFVKVSEQERKKEKLIFWKQFQHPP